MTGVMFPGSDGEGDGIDPVGVTDGRQAVPLQAKTITFNIIQFMIWNSTRIRYLQMITVLNNVS